MENMQKTCWQTLGNFIVYLRDRARIKASRSEKGWSICISQALHIKSLFEMKRLNTHKTVVCIAGYAR